MQIILNPILVRNLGLSQGSSNTPRPAAEKKTYVQDASQWDPATGGLTPEEAQKEMRNLAGQRKQEDKLQEKMQYGSWSQADIDKLMEDGGETWWRNLPSTGDEAMDRLQAKFIAGMDTFYDEDQTRKATAAGYESKYKQTLESTNKQIQQITTDNLQAVADMEANFAALYAQQQTANDANIAKGNDVLAASKAAAQQARDQFAKDSAAAQQRYDSQVARTFRLQTANVPGDQPTATSPVIGDDRRRLIDGSGVNALKIRAPRATGNETSGLAGLQFA